MSYEIIGIPGSDLFKHHSVWSPAAASITVASGFPNISLNVFEAVRKRPSARAPQGGEYEGPASRYADR